MMLCCGTSCSMKLSNIKQLLSLQEIKVCVVLTVSLGIRAPMGPQAALDPRDPPDPMANRGLQDQLEIQDLKDSLASPVRWEIW